jgi:hypothetical protein
LKPEVRAALANIQKERPDANCRLPVAYGGGRVGGGEAEGKNFSDQKRFDLDVAWWRRRLAAVTMNQAMVEVGG